MTFEIAISDLLKIAAHHRSKHVASLRKAALQSFALFLHSDTLQLSQLDAELVSGYLTWLVSQGKSAKTIDLYRNELRNLLSEQLPKQTLTIKKAFAKPVSRRGAKTEGLNIAQLKMLAQAQFAEQIDLTRARDLFLFNVYCGGIDYSTAKSLTTALQDPQYINLPSGRKVRLNVTIGALAAMYASEESDKLFPFCRSISEPRYTELLAEIGDRFRMVRIKDRYAETKAWVSAARELNIDYPVIAACADKPVGILAHYSGEVSQDQKAIDSAIAQVSLAVVDNTEHWYAMKLRRRVSPEEIQELLQANTHCPALHHLTTYYPMQEISARTSHRRRLESKAMIEGVLFFRTLDRYVAPLARLVRDKAWIYRQTNTASAPYAIISQREMENFQRAISQFTDDIAVSIVSNSDITIGKHVRFNYGQFAGCEGIIEAMDHTASSDLCNFYVRFTSDNSFKFQVRVSEGQLSLID